MSEQETTQKHRVKKDIHIDQTEKAVSIHIFRWRSDGDLIHHRYDASPWSDHPVHRTPGFIARRIRRGIRLMNASLKREWGQA
jgi:hypothetical protein